MPIALSPYALPVMGYICPRCGASYVSYHPAGVCECGGMLGVVEDFEPFYHTRTQPEILAGEAGSFRDGRWVPIRVRWRFGDRP